MSNVDIWISSILLAVAAILTRCSFFLFGDVKLPAKIQHALRYAPAAAMAAIVAPDLLMSGNNLNLAVANPKLWAATGIMGLLAEPDAPPPLCRGGQGDHATALNILAATLAALRLRDKTGEGQHVETTLQASGMWTIGADYSAALVSRKNTQRVSRTAPTQLIWNSYRCADGEWLLLVMPVPFPAQWPSFCRMVEHPEWIDAYPDLDALRANTAALTAQVDATFAQQGLTQGKSG